MRWVYDIENCIRYEYPNEPRGPERPNDPPIPPAGWPVPRVGDFMGVDADPGEESFRVQVIGVEWDYSAPKVTVQLEVVRELTPGREQRLPMDEDLEKIRRALGQLNYVKPSKGGV